MVTCSIKSCNQEGNIRVVSEGKTKYFCLTHWMNYNYCYDKVDAKKVKKILDGKSFDKDKKYGEE